MYTRRRNATRYHCKQCSYVDSTQEAIAVHYLHSHLNVDFCTLSQPADERTSREGSEHPKQDQQTDVQETHQDEEQAKCHNAETMAKGGKHTGRITKTRRATERKAEVSKIVIHESKNKELSRTFPDTVDDATVPKLSQKADFTPVTRPSRRKKIKRQANKCMEEIEPELGRGKRKKYTPKRFINEDQIKELKNEKKSEGKWAGEEVLPEQRKLPNTKRGAKKQDSNFVDEELGNEAKRISLRRQDVAQNLEKISSSLCASPDCKNETRKSAIEKPRPSLRKSPRVLSRSEVKFEEDEQTDSKTNSLSQKIERLPIPYRQFKCKIDQMVTMWNTAQQDKKKDSIKKCTFEGCNLETSDDEWSIHVSCHVQSMDGLKCPHCSFMCLYWRHMRKHLRKEHTLLPKRVYPCDQENCDSKFIRFNQLRKHVMDKHLKGQLADRLLSGAYDPTEFEDVDAANQESVPFQTPRRKRNHDPAKEAATQRKRRIRRLNRDENRKTAELNHESKVTFVCDLCLSRFRHEDDKAAHRKEHLNDQDNLLLCLECDLLGFPNSEGLKDHYKKEHKRNLMRYQCEECPFATDGFYQMSSHQAVHTGHNEVMCDQCGKLLANQYNLKVHEFRKHSTEEQKTVVCSACPYRCADKSVLRDHIKQHHKSMLKNPIYHRCPHCDYVGHKLKSLQFHMRIHAEQRSFKCHMCPYAGKTKNHLKIHLHTHDGYASFICSHCDFKGASKKRLSEHLMSQHLKIEPYHCKICQWKTAYSGNMWKHINHHKKTLGNDMPDDPAIVDLELLKGVELPEMPRAPTGKTRRKSTFDIADNPGMNSGARVLGETPEQLGLYVQNVPSKQGTVISSDLQILQISGGSEGRAYVPSEIQIVQIQDDGLVHVQEQVVSEETSQSIRNQGSHMEIVISHESAENGCEADESVEVLRVGQDGTIYTSSMNPDVEVAVLALAHLEPGHHTDRHVTAAGDAGQTVHQNDNTSAICDTPVNAAITAGIHVEATEKQTGAVLKGQRVQSATLRDGDEYVSTDKATLSSATSAEPLNKRPNDDEMSPDRKEEPDFARQT